MKNHWLHSTDSLPQQTQLVNAPPSPRWCESVQFRGQGCGWTCWSVSEGSLRQNSIPCFNTNSKKETDNSFLSPRCSMLWFFCFLKWWWSESSSAENGCLKHRRLGCVHSLQDKQKGLCTKGGFSLKHKDIWLDQQEDDGCRGKFNLNVGSNFFNTD